MKLIYKLLLGGCFVLCCSSLAKAYSEVSCPAYFINLDTIKYRGYRLELTNFKVLKEKGDWIKISFTAVNSGRMDVDMGKEERAHWVIVNFDKSIFDAKLGGYRENIKRQLVKDRFRLAAGKTLNGAELKISSVLPPQYRNYSPPPVASEPKKDSPADKPNSLAWKKNDPPSLPGSLREKKIEEEAPCSDILFSDLKIVAENEKWVTLEYTITNQGDGIFYLYGNHPGKDDNLVINAYISGVTKLTRGAIPIGGQIFPESAGRRNEFKKGEKFTSRIKLDIRKKTRYMKSLILSLDSFQFADECDRINNHRGVVLR